MNSVLASLISTVLISFRSRIALQAEILALRHQSGRVCAYLIVSFGYGCVSQLWSNWRSVLVIVRPETILRWHRQGFRLYWRWKSSRAGRPDTAQEIRGSFAKCAQPLPRREPRGFTASCSSSASRCRKNNRFEIYGSETKVTFSILACFRRQPHQAVGVDRLPRGADNWLQADVCFSCFGP
jgi:hypothetical protein